MNEAIMKLSNKEIRLRSVQTFLNVSYEYSRRDETYNNKNNKNKGNKNNNDNNKNNTSYDILNDNDGIKSYLSNN